MRFRPACGRRISARKLCVSVLGWQAPSEAAIEHYEAAAKRFRELGVVFWLAVTLLEHGELSGDTALLDEAREIFEQLRARPLARAARGSSKP